MSTRSGKRIHSSFHENNVIVAADVCVKSERKTRSKQKENVDVLDSTTIKTKKRKNYVKYPSDDELNNAVPCADDVDGKSVRVLRRNLLTEKNIPDEANIVENSKPIVRHTRRTHKLSENDKDAPESNINEAEINNAKKSKIKKNKKKKFNKHLNADVVHQLQKPKKKKGRNSGSMTIEDIVHDTHNQSVDSFHSAASSPEREVDADKLYNSTSGTKTYERDMSISLKSNKNSCNTYLKSDNEDLTAQTNSASQKSKKISSENDFINGNMAINKSTKKVSLKNSIKLNTPNKIDTTYEKEGDMDLDEKKDITFDKDTNESIISSNKKKRKVLDITLEAEQLDSLTTSEQRSKKRISVINTTYEKDLSVSENNRTLDKLNETQTKRKSIINTTYEMNEKTFDKELNELVNKNKKNRLTLDKNDIPINADSNSTPDSIKHVVSKKKTLIKDLVLNQRSLLTNDENVTFNSATKDSQRKSVINDTTFEKSNSSINAINVTFEKDPNYKSTKQNSKEFNNTELNSSESAQNYNNVVDTNKETLDSTTRNNTLLKNAQDKINKRRKSIGKINNTTFESNSNLINEETANVKDTTFEKETQKSSNNDTLNMDVEERANKRKKSILRRNSTEIDINTEKLNKQTNSETKRKSFTKDNAIVLNETFEKSLLSSDGSISNVNDNITDKALNNISNISITSDESENIINTTPVLIESSIDESLHLSRTPLKREGTFTKDSSEPTIPTTPKVMLNSPKTTPKKQMSLPSAGCTPFHISAAKNKSIMNLTRSIEKDPRPSIDLPPRATKVMFCSPIFDPVMESQQKRKIIKSNLKGSNKSFIYEETAASPRPAPRKRSYTQSDADNTRVKRTRLTGSQQESANRLSRPRTLSASAKLTESVTPTKKTPQKSKPEGKVTRTKLPNFAALHQKQFQQMESLDECQERKARRAKQLLTPTGNIAVLERSSPKGSTLEHQKQKESTKTETSKLPTLDSLRQGYTRFGFKLNMENNPFINPKKLEIPKNPPKNMPSLAGSTTRKEAAKQVVMREKSFTDRRADKRKENRTIIKGVRTNRRFDLQMKMRNIN